MADMMATMGLDDREYRAGLRRVTSEAQEVGRRVSGSLSGGGGAGGAGMAAGLAKAGGVLAAILLSVKALKKAYHEVSEDVVIFAKFNEEAAASLARQNKALEMQKALVGEFFAPLKEAERGLYGLLYRLVPRNPNAVRNFQDDRYGQLLDQGTGRLDQSGGGVQAKIAAEQEASRLILKDLQAEQEAGRVRVSQYEELVALERQRFGLVMDRLLAEENAASAAAIAKRKNEAEEARAHSARQAAALREQQQRADRERADAQFNLEAGEAEIGIRAARLMGMEREAAIAAQRLETARRIKAIQETEGLSKTQRYVASKRAQEQGGMLERLIGERFDREEADQAERDAARFRPRRAFSPAGTGSGLNAMIFGGANGSAAPSGSGRELLSRSKESTTLLREINSLMAGLVRAFRDQGNWQARLA